MKKSRLCEGGFFYEVAEWLACRTLFGMRFTGKARAKRMRFQVQLLEGVSQARPVPRAVHSQFSIIFVPLRSGEMRAERLRFQRSIAEMFLVGEARAKGCSLSIFNYSRSVAQRRNACRTSAFSTFNAQFAIAGRRFAGETRAKGRSLSIFNFQFSTLISLSSQTHS
jgi:hypothetical protein